MQNANGEAERRLVDGLEAALKTFDQEHGLAADRHPEACACIFCSLVSDIRALVTDAKASN